MGPDPALLTNLNISLCNAGCRSRSVWLLLLVSRQGFPPSRTMTKILHYCAENDRNGNPQRVYVMIDEDGAMIAQWDEGYYGFHAVPGPWRDDAYNAERIKISVKEYKRILRKIPTFNWAHDVPDYSHLRQPV